MRYRKAAVVAASMLMLLVFVYMNDDMRAYIAEVKIMPSMGYPVYSKKLTEAEKLELHARISAEADRTRIAPIDARIDRVWKAIPGYNGLEIDVERTYKAAVEGGRTHDYKYYYKEIEPKIGLRDLGPHPIYRGNSSKKMVSLMINVAWGNEYLDAILAKLERENVKATFFLDGSWLKKYPEEAKKIQAYGHEMSNHAYSHPEMSKLSRSAAYEEIAKTEKLLKDTLGVQNVWFAPPSGDFNQMTVQIAEEQGLKLVMWTIDTVDWKKPEPDWIIRKISAKLEPGALILMHPTSSSRDALDGIIATVKRQGYSLGTVSDTLSSAREAYDVVGADLF